MNGTILAARRLLFAFLLVVLTLAIPLIASAADAGFSPITSIAFDGDTPGQPPALGGINQPTSVFQLFGPGSLLVQSSANGINTKPVVIAPDAAFTALGLNTDFASVGTGLLRIEATVSLSRTVFARFLATTGTNGLEVTSLVVQPGGTIEEEFTHVVVGSYAANQPFRIRVDIDMGSKTWSAAVDNELDGFADDSVTSGLPFANVPASITEVHELTTYLQFMDGGGPVSVAYDDITVSVPSTVADSLSDLAQAVVGVGPGTSLADKVSRAEVYFANGDVGNTCEILGAFVLQVTAQTGKSIPTPTAAMLIADANGIRETLNC
jgi:hypothetical protein